ncbi:MAG: hypothetical protein AAGE80_19650 [Pseudomonadota bacterium]
MLLFFTMFGAVIQKTISDSYLSGDFFYYVFLTDPRFEFWTRLFVSDYSPSVNPIIALKQAAEAGVLLPIQLNGTAELRAFTNFVTWFNYVDQILISLLLLVWHKKLVGPKHCVFLLVIAVTYFFAPVYGFGWLLCIFGLAIALQDRTSIWRLYIHCMLLIALYDLLIGTVIF